MPLLQFDCSICKKLYGDARQQHLITKGRELTMHEWFAQCAGCGAFSVKLVDDGLVAGLE